MQKIGILNSDIAKVLADLGHTDTIVIGDCGLPVPAGVPKIDLALKPGTPSFLDVLTEVLKYMEVEKIHIASEMESKNPATWQKMQELFEGKEQILSDHEAFKAATKTAKAVIRTGEITPYANIILHAGVISKSILQQRSFATNGNHHEGYFKSLRLQRSTQRRRPDLKIRRDPRSDG